MEQTANTLQAGTALQGGKYIVRKVLGQGGFGITYLGEQTALGRKVAIKEFFMKDRCERDAATSQVTTPSTGQRDEVRRFLEKFVKEARTIALLEHRNIIRIHDIFEENGTAYYVMEHVSGGSLADKVHHEKHVAVDETMKSVKQVGAALEYIHARNILHLDIKPSNVLLRPNGEAVLIDFGVSKRYDAVGEQTSNTPVGVSKGYAPIEQYVQGGTKSFAPSTDVYSLGALMYNLLTGTTPLEAPAREGDDDLSFPVGTPAALQRVVMKAMSIQRSSRYQSVAAMLTALDAAVKGLERAEKKADDATRNDADDSTTIGPPPIDRSDDTTSLGGDDGDKDTATDDGSGSNAGRIGTIAAVIAAALVIAFVAYHRYSGRSDKAETVEELVDTALTEEIDTCADDPETMLPPTIKAETPAQQAVAPPQAETKAPAKEKKSSTTVEQSKEKMAQSSEKQTTDDTVHDVVEQMPEYPGGTSAMLTFLKNNLHYPDYAVQNNIEGRVIVNFIVEKDGSISNVSVIRSVDPLLDKEACRVVKAMPRWSPGKLDGQAVRVKDSVPVTFKL